MLDVRTRGLLDRYRLNSRSLSSRSGERSSTEAGQSVEFHDYREYEPGDELRYVDWRAYARTGRLYTRLYQAERAVKLHIVVDGSASMSLHGKSEFAAATGRVLAYVAQQGAPTQVHRLGGASSPPLQGRAGTIQAWTELEQIATAAPDGAAPGRATPSAGAVPPVEAIKRFALSLPPVSGNALAVFISDLLDGDDLRGALTALRARRLDAAFVHVVAPAELDPPTEQLELLDVESGAKLPVTPAEVAAYRAELATYLERTRAAITQAGYKYALLRVPELPQGTGRATVLEREASKGLILARLLTRQ